MAFDAMAAAVDWLDAYRAGDIEAILHMYADDAVIECGCGGMKTITGKEALRSYWTGRLREFPAALLEDVKPSGNTGAAILYVTHGEIVKATLEFNRDGQIVTLRCGPFR
jgi:ketosteroid isomerase-like protein